MTPRPSLPANQLASPRPGPRTGIRKKVGLALCGFLALLVAAEVAARWAGLVDWPTYDADSVVGYIPSANQHGRFMNRNDWTFNERHMGAGPFVPDPRRNILLVGDSIVLGGNPYAMHERLGAQVQKRINGKVWPVAAGSWALQNELGYLNTNDDVVRQVDTVAFVLNSGDLSAPSSWSCTQTHPRKRPVSALWFLADKYVLHTPCEGTPPALKVVAQDPLAMLASFVSAHPKTRIVVFLYPDLPQSADAPSRQRDLESMRPLIQAAGVREVISVGDEAAWRSHADYYRDGIHPSSVGVGVLADIIAHCLRSPTR